jgi:hypothetical protein
MIGERVVISDISDHRIVHEFKGPDAFAQLEQNQPFIWPRRVDSQENMLPVVQRIPVVIGVRRVLY